MKRHNKIILIIVIIISTLCILGLYKYNLSYKDVINNNKQTNEDWYNLYKITAEEQSEIKNSINDKTEAQIDKRMEKIKNSERINIVAMGVGIQPLADTIMVISCNPNDKTFDIISIPRDTYYYVEGHESGDHRKINAAYARDREEGILKGVSDILGIPIHNYLKIRYKGVEELVDMIGGVSVNVPFHMKYEDITDIPPLYIDIEEGYQVLDGENAVKYLRYRHGNEKDEKGNYIEGYHNQDLGRTKAQQKFIISAVKQSLNFNLPNIIKKGFEVVKTNMDLEEVLVYVSQFGKIDTEKIDTYNLPGNSKYLKVNGISYSYYVYNEEKVNELIDKIYNIELENE